jgi:hypothetical protein
MNKPFPFARILKALFAGTGWIWGTREHNRAKKLSKKLASTNRRMSCRAHSMMEW